MSLVNVGVLAASAPVADRGTTSAALSTHTPTATFRACRYFSSIMFGLRFEILPHGHFHVGVGPAALEPETALARFVIGLDAQEVIARSREGRRSGDHGALLRHRNGRFVEGDGPGTAELVERNSCDRPLRKSES